MSFLPFFNPPLAKPRLQGAAGSLPGRWAGSGLAGMAGLVLLSSAIAKPVLVPQEELFPQEHHRRITGIILDVLEKYHYKKTDIDDELSSSIMDNYLRILDSNRMYFIKKDIDDFERYRFQLDDLLLEKNLDPVYSLFRLYQRRIRERIEYAQRELETYAFDFTREEEYLLDRSEAKWSASSEELNDTWRKRIKHDLINLTLSGKTEQEARDILNKRYAQIEKSSYQLNRNDIFETFINAFTTAIEPHTIYLSPRTSENFNINMRLSLEGIGAVLRYTSHGEYTQIERLVPGGPAERSGKLHPGDRIVGVGQGHNEKIQDIVGWRLDDVVELIRGPRGTVLRLEILPKGKTPANPTNIVKIVRDRIELEQRAAKFFTLDVPNTDRRIGVLDIPSFYVDFDAMARKEKGYRSTSHDVRKLLAELPQQGIDGLVIDLRNNGGGSLREALELTGMFIESGPIVQIRDARGQIEISRDPDPHIAYSGPLAVLVNRNSASASEIFAGAIQDYKRGIIIGEPTFGKGTVQNIFDLNRFQWRKSEDLGRLKTTVAQFFRVNGSSNQHLGVIPDVIFPTADDVDGYGERSLNNALPWETIPATLFNSANAPVHMFDQVRERHRQRIHSDPEFLQLLEKIEFARKSNGQKSVSLVKTQRELEMERFEEEQERLGLFVEEQAESADEPENDILLRETTRILNDLIKEPLSKEDRSA